MSLQRFRYSSKFAGFFLVALICSSMARAESSFSYTGGAAIDYGNSSNVGLLGQETAATYLKLAPAIGAEWEASASTILSLNTEANFKRYNSEIGRDLGNENWFEARAEVLHFMDGGWEMGGDLTYFTIKNQIPNISTSGVSESTGQKYSEPAARIYVAWFGERFSVEAALGAKDRTYRTLFTDQQGNIYKNNFRLYTGEVTTGYKLSEISKLKFKAAAGREDYSERMASFSEGLEAFPSNPHPLLNIFYHEYSLSLDSKMFDIADTLTTVGTRLNRDQIFGAESYASYKFRQKFEIALQENLSIKPEVNAEVKNFDFYRSNPTQSASTKPTRRDVEFRGITDLIYKFSPSLSLKGHYEFNRLVSNYATLTYSEHKLESGISYKF